jgi:hypothetical protein
MTAVKHTELVTIETNNFFIHPRQIRMKISKRNNERQDF